MICQNCGYNDNGTGDFAHACAPLNLNDLAVQKRLAAQWGYVPASSMHPVINWLRNGCDPMKAAEELELIAAAAAATEAK